MKQIGIVGLGDMGLAMAKNIVEGGFQLTGFDLREERLEKLREIGGRAGGSAADVGADADAVFVMVLNGRQVEKVVLGEDGLLRTMRPGSTIIVSATILPAEIRALGGPIAQRGVQIIDTPVSGGRSSAEAGELTMMAAGGKDVVDSHMDLLETVGKKIFFVGEEIGIGQTVKAALQALIGSTFAAIFESLVLGAKAGVSGEVMYDVFTASGVGSPLLESTAKKVMDREFVGTGSQITTMYKDLGITMALARESGAVLTHRDGLLVLAEGEFHLVAFYPERLVGRSDRGDTCLGSYAAARLTSPPAKATAWSAAVTSLKMEAEGPIARDRASIEQLVRRRYGRSVGRA